MSDALAVQRDSALTSDVLAHIDTQLQSARRMLAIVLEQAGAIRARAVPQVVRLAGALQAEMHRREAIEIERRLLIGRASIVLGEPVVEINILMLTAAMDPESAQTLRRQSAELRGVLSEVQREHTTNRALMQQELSFLDHLLRLAGNDGGYGSSGERHTRARRSGMLRRPVIELEA